MEIEVGEYGRTNKGKIFIFAWLENSDGKRYTNKVLLGNGKIFENKFYYFDDGEEIVKHSKNIIDLIEVGDYVNGEQVSNVDKIDNINFIEWTDGDMYKTEIENTNFIKYKNYIPVSLVEEKIEELKKCGNDWIIQREIQVLKELLEKVDD